MGMLDEIPASEKSLRFGNLVRLHSLQTHSQLNSIEVVVIGKDRRAI